MSAGCGVAGGAASAVRIYCRASVGGSPQRADRHDDAKPCIGAVLVALPPHCLDHLARLHCRVFAVKGDPLMGRAGNVEV
jgi:hypothetical protein